MMGKVGKLADFGYNTSVDWDEIIQSAANISSGLDGNFKTSLCAGGYLANMLVIPSSYPFIPRRDSAHLTRNFLKPPLSE